MKKPLFALAVVGLVASGASAFPTYSGAGFQIPDNDPNGASSTIAVGDSFTVSDIMVTVEGLSHTWAGDLAIYLTNPGSSSVDLVYRLGWTGSGFGTSADYGGNYTFDDSAAMSLWDLGPTFPNPIPGGTYKASTTNGAAASLASLAGGSANGNWTLTIVDNAGGDTGAITGWSLTLVPTPGALALLGIAGLAGGRRRRA